VHATGGSRALGLPLRSLWIVNTRPSRATTRKRCELSPSSGRVRRSRHIRSRSSGWMTLNRRSGSSSHSCVGYPSIPSICGLTYEVKLGEPGRSTYVTMGRFSTSSRKNVTSSWSVCFSVTNQWFPRGPGLGPTQPEQIDESPKRCSQPDLRTRRRPRRRGRRPWRWQSPRSSCPAPSRRTARDLRRQSPRPASRTSGTMRRRSWP